MTPTAVSAQLTAVNESIARIEQKQGQLQERINNIACQRCNGRKWLRPRGYTTFVYTDHTAGVTCPYCGSHPEGKRFRVSHGEEETATADNAMQAIAYEQEYQDKRAELTQLGDSLQRIKRLVWQLERETKAW